MMANFCRLRGLRWFGGRGAVELLIFFEYIMLLRCTSSPFWCNRISPIWKENMIPHGSSQLWLNFMLPANILRIHQVWIGKRDNELSVSSRK
jgi:hypothetical protein